MPVPQELFFLVGWAGEPVPSIDERIFARGLILIRTQKPGFLRKDAF
ncbi:hypothetical protein QUB70_10350 [Microcoleus sp. A003_D6]